MATTARQYPLRSASTQTKRLNESVLLSAPIKTERAPWASRVRKYESPAFVMGEDVYALPFERHVIYFLQTQETVIVTRVFSQYQNAGRVRDKNFSPLGN